MVVGLRKYSTNPTLRLIAIPALLVSLLVVAPESTRAQVTPVAETDLSARPDLNSDALQIPETTPENSSTDADAVVEIDEEVTVDVEDNEQGIEVILVQAQRRSEDLQTVPESVSSFSANDLLEQGLEDFTDLQFSVPNLYAGTGGTTQITSRGVGSEIVGPGVDPGFAVHVNNVFSSREATGLSDFFDIERVDVLRGPQGTLWGRNSTGGAVNIITKRPQHDFDTFADVEYGSSRKGGEATRFIGMLNMPLVQDELALRVAFLAYFNNGATKSVVDTNDQRLNDAAAVSLRTSLRWQPNLDFTVDLIGNYLRSHSPGRTPKFEGDYDVLDDPIVSDGVGPGVDYTGAQDNPSSPYRIATDERQDTQSTTTSLTLLSKYQADQFQFESITGFQSTNFKHHRDADGSSLPIATLDLEDKSRQISQEFLINSTWNKSFHYTVGTNYQYDYTPKTELFAPNAANTEASTPLFILAILNGASLVDGCEAPGDPGCPPPSGPGVPREDFLRARTKVKNHVYGAYANFSLDVLKDLTLSAGGRFSYTYRDWNDSTRAQSFLRVPGPFALQVLQLGQPQKKSWKSGTWNVTANYQALKNHNLSATVSTGSRAGGFNFADEQSFGSEEILSIEARSKSTFFGRRLIVNLTGFWYDWDNPQIRSTEDGLPITVNAPSAETYGAELEFRALPLPGLALNGSFGWLEANYDKKFLTIDRTDPDLETANPLIRSTIIDINGNRLPRSPRFTASFGAQYEMFLGDYGSITPRVDFYYRGKFSFRQYKNSLDEQPAYTRTDARVTWKSDTGQYWVQAFARNLEDEAVKSNQQVLAAIYRQHYYDPPRSGGVRVGYNFY